MTDTFIQIISFDRADAYTIMNDDWLTPAINTLVHSMWSIRNHLSLFQGIQKKIELRLIKGVQ